MEEASAAVRADQCSREQTSKRRTSDSSYERPKPPSPGLGLDEDDFERARYPDAYGYPRRFQDDHIPPPAPMNISHLHSQYPSLGNPIRQQTDFSRYFSPFLHSPSKHLGDEILGALRSRRGGIYYTKANQFKEIHFVDQDCLYTCRYVPPGIIPHNEEEVYNTKLGMGLVRKEALDLLGYSYVTSKTGMFAIADDLEFVGRDHHAMATV